VIFETTMENCIFIAKNTCFSVKNVSKPVPKSKCHNSYIIGKEDL